ncbi:hypothetical protein BH10ACT8_BH10ACT8_17570 [soil metagenome]
MISAGGLLSGHAHFLHWGVVQISLANLIVILVMVAVFVLALVLPFPGNHDAEVTPSGDTDDHV